MHLAWAFVFFVPMIGLMVQWPHAHTTVAAKLPPSPGADVGRVCLSLRLQVVSVVLEKRGRWAATATRTEQMLARIRIAFCVCGTPTQSHLAPTYNTACERARLRASVHACAHTVCSRAPLASVSPSCAAVASPDA